MSVQEINEKDKEKYQKNVSHLVQSWEWGEFRKSTGVKVFRFGEFEKSKLISSWQIFFHKIPHTSYTIGYLSRTIFPNKEVFEYLRKIGKENHCLFIRLEPDMFQDSAQKIPPFLKKAKPILPQHTLILDLSQKEDDLLKQMHEKTRYNIRVAQKHQIIIKEENDKEAIDIFAKLMEITEKRQGFYSRSGSYLKKQWDILKLAKMIHLLVAYDKNQPLSAIWLLQFKDQLYYVYGGSSDLHREKMPNYLLHFEAIKLGKKLGCKTYDFWGSYLDKPEPSDAWYGIYRFKSGFGGQEISYTGAFDFVLEPKLYQIYKLTDFLRWKFLKLKRKIH